MKKLFAFMCSPIFLQYFSAFCLGAVIAETAMTVHSVMRPDGSALTHAASAIHTAIMLGSMNLVLVQRRGAWALGGMVAMFFTLISEACFSVALGATPSTFQKFNTVSGVVLLGVAAWAGAGTLSIVRKRGI